MKVHKHIVHADGRVEDLGVVEEPMTITVKSVQCPVCGSPEIDPATAHLPAMEQKLLIRGFKVGDEHGWWSECLVCKEDHGNGWWCDAEDGSAIIEPSRIAALEAKGFTVERR